jgi:NhaP-type Na+/H+ or K+/H+ antiporter
MRYPGWLHHGIWACLIPAQREILPFRGLSVISRTQRLGIPTNGTPVISLVAGLIFSPHASNLLKPEEYALHDVETLETITLYFTRLVLGVQLVLAGVQLPSKYLQTEWKSLSLLLGPGMTVMWIVTSLLVFAFVPHISFLQALAVGACVTPTDPVLSNSIVKGKFADKNIPKELQKIVIAESGANDGLGYPFLFLPLYLIMHVGHGGQGSDGSVKHAIGLWFGETWGYTIILSVVYGATVGWIAKELLHWAEDRKYVDRESFLVFAITLAVSPVHLFGQASTILIKRSCSSLVQLEWSVAMMYWLASSPATRSHGMTGLGSRQWCVVPPYKTCAKEMLI